MRSVLVAVAVVLGSVAAALSLQPQLVLACSGPGPVENMLSSTIIIEGRVTSITPGGEPGFDRAPYKITFDVARAFKGAAAGQKVVATGYIPIPGKPIMCPQFPQDLLGKYVVIGLGPNQERPGELLADAWVMSFIGDKPEGEAYDRGVRLAEMISDSNPSAPQLILDPPVATCGQPMRFVGRRFPEGRYLLRYGFGRAIAFVDVGPDGGFEMTATVLDAICRSSQFNSRLVSFHVSALVDRGSGTEIGPFGPTEIAAAPLAGAVDREPPWPMLTITPNPARCGDTFTIRGAGFEPAEKLVIAVDGDSLAATVSADLSGNFTLQHRGAAAACEPMIRVTAGQAGFEALLPFPELAGAYVFQQTAAPGPPDLGTGPLSGHTDRHGLLAAGLILLCASAGFGAAARGSARRLSPGRTQR